MTTGISEKNDEEPDRQQYAVIGTYLLLTVFFITLYFYLAHIIEKQAQKRLSLITMYAAEAVNGWLDNHTLSVELAAAFSQAPLSNEQLARLFPRVAASSRTARLLVLHLEGEGLFMVDGAVSLKPETSKDYARWLYLLSQPMPESRLTDPIPSLIGNEHEILIAQPLLNAFGMRVGALGLRLPLAELINHLHGLEFLGPLGRRALIVSNTGQILAATDAALTRDTAPGTPIPAVLEKLLRDRNIKTTQMGIEGKDYYASLDSIGRTGWNILTIGPLSHELALRGTLRGALLASWLFLSLLGALFVRQNRRYYHYKVLSERDRLTGAGNRLAFEKNLADMRESRKFPVCLLIMDVDGLKQINDTLGHEAGDALLRRVAALLQRSLRDSDTIYRVGGDEFAVFLPGTSREQALLLAERINARAAATRVGSVLPPVYYSLGLAEAVNPDSLASLFRTADEAMYEDKNNRRKASHEAIRTWLEGNASQPDRRAN